MGADVEHDYATIRQLMNALIAESSGVAVKPGLEQTIEAVMLATEDLAPTRVPMLKPSAST